MRAPAQRTGEGASLDLQWIMDRPKRALLPRWASVAVLAAAAAWLTLRWDSIPARWTIHWGIDGTPNGWAQRTVLGVYGPLFIGVGLLLALEALGAVLRKRAVEDAAMEPVREATRQLMRAVTLAISLLLSLLSVMLPLHPHLPPAAEAVLCLVLIGGATGMGVARLSAARREVQRSGHAARVEGYHAFYYSNDRDPRLWVPKLGGPGLTINFAHPWAWPVMLLLLAVPIALAIVAATSH